MVVGGVLAAVRQQFGFPETSAPSPGAFSAAFSAAADDGATGVVCVTLSSKLSATYQAAPPPVPRT